MFESYIRSLQFLAVLSMCLAYKLQPFVSDGIPANAYIDLSPFFRILNGYYYFETNLTKNWYGANQACHQMGAELISIDTLEEWDAVNKYLKDTNTEEIYWTSGTDLAKEGTHVWFTNGKPITLDIWCPGEPNNSNGIEHCDDLGMKCGSSRTGLNDANCLKLHRYICEATQPITASFVVW